VSPKPPIKIDDASYVKALAHPLRIRILAILKEEQRSPVQLAEQLDAPLGTVAYHVRTLYNLGLLELVRTRQRRGATEHVYQAREHPRFSDEAWDALNPVAKQRMLSAMLQQIGEYATGSAAVGGFDRPDAHITRTALDLDEQGWGQLATATKRWLGDVDRIEEAARKRLAQRQHPDEARLSVGLVIMLFEALPFSRRSAAQERGARATRRPTARTLSSEGH
jgi:DNA-binding transcriptional ArsR family regulator